MSSLEEVPTKVPQDFLLFKGPLPFKNFLETHFISSPFQGTEAVCCISKVNQHFFYICDFPMHTPSEARTQPQLKIECTHKRPSRDLSFGRSSV